MSQHKPMVQATLGMYPPKVDIQGQIIEDFYGYQFRWRESADQEWTVEETVIDPETSITITVPADGKYFAEVRAGVHAAKPHDSGASGQGCAKAPKGPYHIVWGEWSDHFGFSCKSAPPAKCDPPFLVRTPNCAF